MKLALLIIALAVSGSSIAAEGVTPAEGFNQGSEIGKKFLNNELPNMPVPGINDANAVDKLPGDYTGTVPTGATGLDAAGLYGGGIGDLMTPGLQKNSDCMAMVDNPDVKQQVPCDAIKTLNESDKGGFVFSKNDPILVRSKAIQNDPGAILDAAGMEMKVTEMACAPGTSAVPTESEIRVCNEAMVATPGSCQPFEDVQIDRFANFKCKQSQNPLEHPSCEKTMDVVVNVSQTCVPNTWVRVAGIDGASQTSVDYYCEINQAATHLKLRFNADGLHGTCQVGYANLPKAPFVVPTQENVYWSSEPCNCTWVNDGDGNLVQICDTCSSYTVNRAVGYYISHWKGGCTVGQSVVYVANAQQGCTGGLCTYSLRFIEMGPYPGGAPNGTFYNTDVLRVQSGGPRWGNVGNRTISGVDPQKIVSTTHSWINQCVPYEARVQ